MPTPTPVASRSERRPEAFLRRQAELVAESEGQLVVVRGEGLPPRQSVLRRRSAPESARRSIVELLNANPVLSDPNSCCWCGGTDRAGDVLLPFGVSPSDALGCKAVAGGLGIRTARLKRPAHCWQLGRPTIPTANKE
jgi:hypothetical protein